MEDDRPIRQLLVELELFIENPNSDLIKGSKELEIKYGITEPFSKFYMFEKLSLSPYPFDIVAFSSLKDDPEIHDYLKERIQEIKSSAAKAVYYELLFQCMNKYKDLLEAGNLYLEYLKWLIDNKHYERASWILRRISTITNLTKAKSLIERAFNIIKEIFNEFFSIQELNRSFRIQCSFTDIPHLITEEMTVFIIEKTEALFYEIINEDVKHLEFVLPYYLKFLQKKKFNDELIKNQEIYFEILRFLGKIHLIRGEGGKSSHYIERAIKTASDLGYKNELKDLNISLKESIKKIQWIETKIDVKIDPKTLLKDFEDEALKFFKNTKYPYLELFSIQFSTIPSINDLIKNIKTDIEKGIGVWRAIFPTKKYSDGLPRDHFDQTTVEGLEKRGKEELVRWTLFSTIHFNAVFKLLKERGDITINKINAFLLLKLGIKEENLALIFYGIDLHFKNDFIGSIHILLPQIEYITRKIIFKKYPELLKHKISETGIETYQPIFTILGTEEASHIFSKPLLDLIITNFYDPKHRNIRNRFMHGFSSINECTEDLSFFCIWVLLMICKNIDTSNENSV